MEIWKEIPSYGGHYEASNLGQVRVKDKIVKKYSYFAKKEVEQSYRGKILRQINNGHGYKMVSIGYDNKTFSCQIGRLVLMAFKGMPKKEELCCHNNSDPSDNRIENLRWGDQKNNMKDRMDRGKYLKAQEHFMSKLTNEQVLEIYNSNDVGLDLAKRFNISNNTVGRIRKGILWQSITGGKSRNVGKLYIGTRPQDKFTPNKVREIRRLRKEGMMYKDIGKIYGSDATTICQMCNYRTWKHID